MAYTHTTYAALKTALAGRLGDPDKRFWTDTNLGVCCVEALRTYGLCSGFWRARGTFSLTSATDFYDLRSLLTDGATLLLNSTVTDRDIIESVQFALLESASTQASWPGTAQFTYADISAAVTRRRNQFLADTGIILTRSTQALEAPPISRQTMPDTVIDVRRAAVIGAAPLNYYTTLWRTDERELSLSDASWFVNSGQPTTFSVMAPPPLTVQLAPPPSASGTLDTVTVDAAPSLDPSTSATALGIPDDVSPAIKWGALADLLGIDGQARDSQRAAFCEARYQQFVQLTRMLSAVINAEINGVSVIPTTLYELDAAVPDWQNVTGTPSYAALAGWNLLAAYPVPDSTYSCTLDVVRRAPIPVNDAAYIQVGREQIDSILDYAEHLAMFKCGGYEFAATERQAQNFLVQSVTYNQRLSASAKYIFAAKETSQREKASRPRRQQSDGLGALPSVQEAQSFVAGNAPIRMKRS